RFPADRARDPVRALARRACHRPGGTALPEPPPRPPPQPIECRARIGNTLFSAKGAVATQRTRSIRRSFASFACPLRPSRYLTLSTAVVAAQEVDEGRRQQPLSGVPIGERFVERGSLFAHHLNIVGVRHQPVRGLAGGQ